MKGNWKIKLPQQYLPKSLFLTRKTVIVVTTTLLFLSCSNRSKQTDTTDSARIANQGQQSDSLIVVQRNYEKSLIYSSTDSDSLLLDMRDLQQIIYSFVSKAKKTKEKEYGAGDYFGKYRIYVYHSDTLVIDKGDGGDDGFSNAQYLKRNDSLVLYREYKFKSLADSITEQVIKFKKGSMTFLQRKKKPKDWRELGFEKIRFDTIKYDPVIQYRTLQKQLRGLFKRELVE